MTNSVELPLPVGRKETAEVMELLTDVLEQAKLNTVAVEFPDAAPSGPKEGVTVEVQAVDGNSIRQMFGDNKVRRVEVNRTGGTAAGWALNGAAADVTLTFEKGTASFEVTATGTGTVILGLTDIDSAGVTVTDTCTVTLS